MQCLNCFQSNFYPLFPSVINNHSGHKNKLSNFCYNCYESSIISNGYQKLNCHNVAKSPTL